MDDETREEIEYDSEMDAMYDIWNDIYEDVDAILRKYNEDCHDKYDYLYHFTTGEGLLKIITGQSLLLSEREYMNDIFEVDYTNNLIKSVMGNSSVSKDRFEYIFSTSTQQDSIHMWSYYSKDDAYCLKLNREELKEQFFNEGDILNYPAFYGKVIYDEKTQLAILTEVKKLIDSRGYDQNDRIWIQDMLISFLDLFINSQDTHVKWNIDLLYPNNLINVGKFYKSQKICLFQHEL
ncbi:MAG: hypothetical protein L6V90_09950 [Treponema succinifaciens]|nr:MAG: hypothetical protein L6V90_09950 [Treponema succinifaciens]